MSLFGALYAGVAGLGAQSNTLGIVSDNIANANTVGYKQGSGAFETLVTASSSGASSSAAYSPGGVLSGNQQLVTQQGLLQTSSSPTDIAISGAGLFVANQKADGTGQVQYTRAGSFSQDKTGNFINHSGLYLQAWPLDRNGSLPGAPGNTNTISSTNLSSLKTVNVQNLTGTASTTDKVSIGANLKASQTNFPGAGGTISMDAQDPTNVALAANSLILPSNVDHLTAGDQMTVTTGSGLSYTYSYGGISASRNVTSSPPSSNNPTTLGNNPFATDGTDGVVTVTHTAHGLTDGQTVTLSGASGGAIGGIPSADFNGTFIIHVISANQYTITTVGTSSSATTGGGAAIQEQPRPFAVTGTILDATTPNQAFLSVTGASGFSPASLSFTINTAATGTVKFTYTPTAPNTQLNQFNNLTNLAIAISNVSGLTARVSNNQLFVGATDGTAAITFGNGDALGTPGSPVQPGINWVSELGLSNVSAAPNRFSTIQGLSQLANASAGIVGIAGAVNVANPLGAATLKISVNNPLDTIRFADGSPIHTNTGSLLSEFSLTPTLNSGSYVAQTTGSLGPAYDPIDSTKNMASGVITPQFKQSISVYDALGSLHNLEAGFIKTSSNTWAVEVYSSPATDISTTLSSGLLAFGTMTFNGDGSLGSISPALSGPIHANWTNGSTPGAMTINWGTAGQAFGTPNAATIGQTDGMSQFDSAFTSNFVNQNGAPVGKLTGVAIDASGYVTASYNNGEVQKLYKIPLAQFSNANGLQTNNGNAYQQSAASGEVSLREAGDSGVGTISPGAVEQSNVDVASQLTNMIIAQQAYQANSKVIQTVQTLLQALNQVVQ